MTLVLALECQDGIVLASDGQSTSDAAGQPTRARVRKLFTLDGRFVWGAAGSVGLQQTLQERLEGLVELNGRGGHVRRELASIVIDLQQQAMRDFVPHPGTTPPELACLFCWCDADGPRILSVPRTGGDHQFHSSHAAIGSGDIFAELAVRSLLHIGSPELTVEQAKMVAYKAVADAIEVAAVYLGPPIQMYVVTPDGVHEVPEDEIEGGLADAVGLWGARQREVLGALAA
jgi:20S proteasome alpha/beta subunit